MRKYTNKRYNTIAAYVLAVIALTMLMVICIFRFSTIWSIVSKAISVLSPVIWGFAIAFILNPAMRFIDRFISTRIFKKKERPRLARVISVALVILLLLVIIGGTIALILPSLFQSLYEIFRSTPDYINKVQGFVNDVFKDNKEILNTLTDKLTEFAQDTSALWERVEPVLTNLMSSIWSVVTFLKNFFLGIIISVYLLYSKEKLIAQCKKIMLAFSKKTSFDSTISILNRANKTFSGFISGKLLDSLIIGVMCGVILAIFNFPYPLMIAVFVGITNVIPFFGPFIGAIPSALLILLVEPDMVIWFIIVIILIQQFDGNILGPKILGDSTGLPAIWVLVSILVGGGLFGFLGMILAVPAFAIIYDLLREYISNKLRKKHLPTDTDYYKNKFDTVVKKNGSVKILSKSDLDKIKIPAAEDVNQAK